MASMGLLCTMRLHLWPDTHSYLSTHLSLIRLARDTSRDVLVAVKRLYNPLVNQERAKFCFRELHLLNCLRHPNVPQRGGGEGH